MTIETITIDTEQWAVVPREDKMTQQITGVVNQASLHNLIEELVCHNGKGKWAFSAVVADDGKSILQIAISQHYGEQQTDERA